MTNTEIEIKDGDVFDFEFNEEEKKKRFEPRHCFDGQLVATKESRGLILVDTYWMGSENKWFTIEDANRFGTLTFKCNKYEVDSIKEYERDYYADEDIINLSRQHGCYPNFAIKRGTKRSKDKMLSVLKYRIEEAQGRIKSAEWDVKRHTEKLNELINTEDITDFWI